MPGRQILEKVVILHEIIHELHRRKWMEFYLKLFFKKVYDKVKCPFMQQVIRMNIRFGVTGSMILCKGGSMGVRVNDDIGHFFRLKKF
jgi:hypothetical protein